jgi:hypothetical protein
MHSLYEKYWSIASELDAKEKADKKTDQKLRWNKKRLQKANEEYMLTDKLVAALD